VTGIVVAHRASTVLLADRVALVADGRITHVGTHTELLADVPEYRDLLAADDGLDDDLEPATVWEADEEWDRLEREEVCDEGDGLAWPAGREGR
jgi:ATP-binding cassette subfamily B protein